MNVNVLLFSLGCISMQCISNMDPRGEIGCLTSSAHINQKTHPIKESSPSWLPPSTIAWDNEVRGSFFCGVKEGEMQTIRRHK